MTTQQRIERIAKHAATKSYVANRTDLLEVLTIALTEFAEEEANKWQPIETAPKDGTIIDLWVSGSRWANCAWGKPDHECGEAGSYCDSDWHTEKPRWYDTTFGEFLPGKPSHWQPLPEAPKQD